LLPPGIARAAENGAEQITIRIADGRSSTVTRWRATVSRGTILFSHGALSAPAKYTALIAPWVAAGFDVWAPLHVDSTDHPDTKQYPGLASWPARIEDMRALAEHVGAVRYVAAGHSYGALVALTLGGASPTPPPGVSGPLRDPRAGAVVAFSPPGPGMGLIDAAGYATLAVPGFIETGTADIPAGTPPSPAGWRGHLAAYESARTGGDRYALVLDGADHYLGGLICRPELPGPKQQALLDLAVVRSLAFLRGYGLNDGRARQALAIVASAAPATAPGLFRR
jgi:pimeloyl-ACP methyl ester carboxylesterase